MTPTPTPAQLAKAREIADRAAMPLFAEPLDARDDLINAIARALADEAQQAERLRGELDAAEQHVRILQQQREEWGAKLAEAEQRGRQAGLREAAGVAWDEGVRFSSELLRGECYPKAEAREACIDRVLALLRSSQRAEKGPSR